MHTQAEFLHTVLPYRMRSINVFHIALQYVRTWKEPKEIEIYFGGELCIRGHSTAWTNPVIEAGIIHCRACLEFLGLREDPRRPLHLATRRGKRPDDFGIEDFNRPLLSVDDAVAPYAGPPEEAENALASVIHTANKGMAHTTSGQVVEPGSFHVYEIAARGIPTLLVNHLYVPLGIEPPQYQIESTLRGESA